MDLKTAQKKFIRNLIIVIVLISGILLILQQSYDRYLRDIILKSYITELATKAENEFNLYSQPVITNLVLAQSWGQSGLLNLQDNTILNATLIPILEQNPQIFAAKIVDSLGNFYSLKRINDKWETIETITGPKKSQTVVTIWSDENKLIKKEKSNYNYAPLERPWFIGAKDSIEIDSIYWTKARNIISAKSPGITASIRWRNKNSQIMVLAFDVLLRNIYNTISNLKIRDNISVFLFRENAKIFNEAVLDSTIAGLSHDENFFIDPDEIDRPIVAASLKEWTRGNREFDEPLRFNVNNTSYWSGFRLIKGERALLRLGFIIPEKDLFGQVQERQGILIILYILILLSGFVMITWLVKKYRNPLSRSSRYLTDDSNIEHLVLQIIKNGESYRSEFKSTMRMNLKTGEAGREIEMAWLKAVSAFMNSEGGILLFGIEDNGQILGIEADNFENEDRTRLHFKNLINQHIGAEFSSSLRFHILTLSDKTVAALECEPSPKPVFLKNKSEEFFYIRSGPSSIKLSASKAIEYLENRKSRLTKRDN